jgi:hypothetical protein
MMMFASKHDRTANISSPGGERLANTRSPKYAPYEPSGPREGALMTRRLITRIGWVGFLLLLLCAFVTPQPYARWADSICLVWVIASVAYTLAFQSSKPRSDLLKTAVVTCVLIAGVCGLLHGEPSFDENGNVIHEGFATTFNSKAAAGVKVFIKLMVAAYIGLRLADNVRQSEHQVT